MSPTKDPEKTDRESVSFAPPLFRSKRGLAAYYVAILPVLLAAVFCLVQGGDWLQVALYLIVGLVAVLSLSYTGWLAYTILGSAAWNEWRQDWADRSESRPSDATGPLSMDDSAS